MRSYSPPDCHCHFIANIQFSGWSGCWLLLCVSVVCSLLPGPALQISLHAQNTTQQTYQISALAYVSVDDNVNVM